MKHMVLMSLLLVACNDKDHGISESRKGNHHHEASSTDQVMAKVVAEPFGDGPFYMVTITNIGSQPFAVSGLVRQQWCEISTEGEASWKEQPHHKSSHSHDNPTLASGDRFTRLVERWTSGDMPLRFGFVMSALTAESEPFTTWSEPVNPAKDWPEISR